MTSRSYGYVSKPIKCPCCNVVTAVPFDHTMWLTEDAAGLYPNGYRCKAHAAGRLDLPQPSDAPQRLTPHLAKRWAEMQAKSAEEAADKAALERALSLETRAA